MTRRTARLALTLVCLASCGGERTPEQVGPPPRPDATPPDVPSPPEAPSRAEATEVISRGADFEWFEYDCELYRLLPPGQPVIMHTLSRDGETWSECLTARPAIDAASGGAAWVDARAKLRDAAKRAGLVCDESRCGAGDQVVELDELRVCRPVADGMDGVSVAFSASSVGAWNGLGVFRTVFRDEHVVFMSRRLIRGGSGPSERRYVTRYEDLSQYAEGFEHGAPKHGWARPGGAPYAPEGWAGPC